MPVLDVLRSCAILLVFAGHFAGMFNAAPWLLASPVVYYGWTGVDLFFVLSGVLIGTQLWRELARTGDIRVGRFLLRRGLRIWPLYFSFVALVAAEVVLIGRSGSGLWADATYLSNYFHCQIGGSWSLSTEEQFYILAPLSLVAFKRVLKPGRMWIVPVAALLLVNLTRAVTVWHSTLGEAALRQALYFPIHTHADGLALGMLLSWAAIMRLKWITSAAARWLIAIAMFGAGVLVYRIMPVVTNFTAIGLIYGSFTLIGMAATRLPAALKWHGFYVISRLSFSMYLNHFGLLDHLSAYMGGWRKSGGEPAFWACGAISLLLSISLAGLTFLLIEWPFLRLRSFWMAGKSAPKAVAALAGNGLT
jgi:peptidoglycan/LPS O-acetylase OafA/YrhL